MFNVHQTVPRIDVNEVKPLTDLELDLSKLDNIADPETVALNEYKVIVEGYDAPKLRTAHIVVKGLNALTTTLYNNRAGSALIPLLPTIMVRKRNKLLRAAVLIGFTVVEMKYLSLLTKIHNQQVHTKLLDIIENEIARRKIVS